MEQNLDWLEYWLLATLPAGTNFRPHMHNRRFLQMLSFASANLCVVTSRVDAQNPTRAGSSSDTTVVRGIAASPGRLFEIGLATGGSLVIHGWERDSVHVRAHLAGRDWRSTKVHLDRIPQGVRLRTGLGGSPLEMSTSHEFEIWVPSNSDIELQSGGGSIEFENVHGELRGQTQGGSIELEHVRGLAQLSTRGGNIRISDSHLEGRVTTRGGEVELTRVTGGVRAAVERESLVGKRKAPKR